MAASLKIVIKQSRHTGLIYFTMTGMNGEKISHSEGYQNMTYFRNLMKRFQVMGFIIENTTKYKI